MIQLKTDCLIFQTNDGEQVPCSAEWVTLELMGEGAQIGRSRSRPARLGGRPALFQARIAAAVCFRGGIRRRVGKGPAQFRPERLCRSRSPVQARRRTARAPRSWIAISERWPPAPPGRDSSCCSFRNCARNCNANWNNRPMCSASRGLRDCVKQLAGTPRWNRRCQNLNDQIVDFLRSCWQTESASQSCALVVL